MSQPADSRVRRPAASHPGSWAASEGADEERSEGWFFLRPDRVPDRWADRGVPLVMVPLFPDEVASILEPGPTDRLRADEEQRLLRLVARGLSVREIALQFSLSARSVQRRLSLLRRRYGAASTSELRALLVARGFER